VKRNSWFVVKLEDSVDFENTSWFPSLGKNFERNFRKAAQVAVAIGREPAVIAAEMKLDMVMREKRVYWREDWEKVDDLEGGSVWTPYRREAIKFQKRTDAEDFAFQRTRDFPPYIGLIKVERLRWNPAAKGPCGPVVAMYSLAT